MNNYEYNKDQLFIISANTSTAIARVSSKAVL
jgi:hypothetical protein